VMIRISTVQAGLMALMAAMAATAASCAAVIGLDGD
jgi:hypothetical protein